ncbi:hypothetical protein HAX54_001812, partial [Datura stramonium]|nr:hypothetical protein [Datura stramonium]
MGSSGDVKQLLVTGPSGKYYLVEGNSGIRTLESSLSSEFFVIRLFAIDEGEDIVPAPNISQFNKLGCVATNVGTDCQSCEDKEDDNEPYISDYNSEELEVLRKEKNREINEKIDRFLELKNVMFFKDLQEAKRVVSFYSVSMKNKRVTQEALAHYFKKKAQNNSKYKVKDTRQDLDDQFSLNAYAQELRETNPGADVMINISKKALEQGKRRSLSIYVEKWLERMFEAIHRFIELLRNSLELTNGERLTFMSDMQKGLLDVLVRCFLKNIIDGV